MKLRNILLLTLCIAVVMFIPWLGVTDFYSKGEPREAIVAVSMLESGNWVLPESYGSDIAYKPPLLAWLIGVCSVVLNGGVVNEFTSRLPSALAACLLLCGTAAVVFRQRGFYRALVTVVVTATSFEVMRAAEACRVDMLLAAFTCCGLYAIWAMRRRWWWSLVAVVMLSGAALAKGPVGVMLPCLAAWIYGLLRGDNFFRVTLSLAAVCVASFAVPALWYYAAYQQGGEDFLRLVLEENLGRLTGTMSYDSHVNPWWYNVTSMLAGLLPWTVPALMVLFYPSIRRGIKHAWQTRDRGWGLFAVTAFATIFVFYCIPESKRSVYLLPCYPFAAYGIAWLLIKAGRSPIINWWTVVMGVIGVAAPLVFVAGALGWIPGLRLAELHWWLWPVAFTPLSLAVWMFMTRDRKEYNISLAMAMTVAVYVAYNGAFMPMVLNARSDFEAARVIENTVPEDAPIVGVIEEDSLIRYYSLNFYLGDRLRRSTTMAEAPDSAWVLTGSAYGTDAFSERDTVMISRRESDTRLPVYLLSPVRRDK